MNLLLKSSILALLSTSLSSTAYANICVETGQNAAELVVLENWCTPDFYTQTIYPSAEERCRREAIDTCQDKKTLENVIKRFCPTKKKPKNKDINDLGKYCPTTVDGLIGRPPPPTRRPTRSPTRRPTPAPNPPTVESGFRAGQDAMRQWYRDEGNTCANAWSGIINPAANEIKNSQFPNSGSSSTSAYNQAARNGVDSEVAKIQDECFADVSAARALRGHVI